MPNISFTTSARIALALNLLVCATIQPVSAYGAELAALDEQDTIVVTADQAWESDDGNVLNFEGNFELTAPDYYLHSNTAEIHGAMEDPDRIVASGDPVTFWIRDTDADERIHGQANRVEYDRVHDLLRLTGNASLHNDNTAMKSSLLEYDTGSKRLISTGTDGVEIVTHRNRD